MSVNGSELDTITIGDRSLAYDGGVFETILTYQQQLILDPEHLGRYEREAHSQGILLDKRLLEQKESSRRFFCLHRRSSRIC